MPTSPIPRAVSDVSHPALVAMFALALGAACFGVDVDPVAPTGPDPPGGGPPLPVTQPLGVRAVAPVADAAGVPVDAVVTVTFNRPVDPASIDGQSFQVIRRPGIESVPIAGTFGLADSARAVTFRPAGGFANNTAYDLVLTSGIRSADGQGPPFTGTRTSFATSPVIAQHADPPGDTFERVPPQLVVPPDLIAVTVQQLPAGLQFTLTFEGDVDSLPDQASSVAAFIDLDLDQNAGTGEPGAVDQFGTRGTSGTRLGVEVVIEIQLDGTAIVLDAADGATLGILGARVSGRVLELTVPYAMLGFDDGNVGTAVVVGTRLEATDVAPNSGHLAVGVSPSAVLSAIAPSGAADPLPRHPAPNRVAW